MTLPPSLNSSAVHRSGFSVGGLSVLTASERRGDIALVPSLEPFRIETDSSDISILVDWVDRFCPMPGPWLFDSGSTWRVRDLGHQLQFDFLAPAFPGHIYKQLLIDDAFSQARVSMNAEFFAESGCAPAALGYPLDELLVTHRLTQEKAIELHGCGIVGPGDTNNLFIGHSGAGKSTTTRLWTASEDVHVLSDDRIIVRKQSGRMMMYGTPWHGEAMYASPASAPLTRILVLEHGHGNMLTRLSPSQAVAELFARSFVPMHRHEYVESALAFLEGVAESVPCYRYSFEPDARAVEKILNFHD